MKGILKDWFEYTDEGRLAIVLFIADEKDNVFEMHLNLKDSVHFSAAGKEVEILYSNAVDAKKAML